MNPGDVRIPVGHPEIDPLPESIEEAHQEKGHPSAYPTMTHPPFKPAPPAIQEVYLTREQLEQLLDWAGHTLLTAVTIEQDPPKVRTDPIETPRPIYARHVETDQVQVIYP